MAAPPSLQHQAASLAEQITQYRKELFDVVAFWERNSIDSTHGGYFTCLNQDGSVFDTDKIAESGAKFLEKHGRNEDGLFYFSLTADGRPIMQPHSIFSDCFAAMAFAQYSSASGNAEQWARDLAVKTFDNIEKRKANPKGVYNKSYPGTRSFKSLAVPMIDINLCLEMVEVIPDLEVTDRITKNIAAIFDTFLDKDSGLLRENVSDVAADQDTFEGRLLNPGHAIEACWFLMDVARKRNIPNVIDRAGDILLRTVEYGWDAQHGGIFYFMDAKGKPPQQLEWDQKLCVGLSLGYLLSTDAARRARFEAWYHKVHAWSWARFPDKAHGEWFGYLNRRGEVLLPLKGGKWKGCFHVPRSMLLCWHNFEAIAKLH